jgi:DNA-binding FadR family transcriptional regulator
MSDFRVHVKAGPSAADSIVYRQTMSAKRKGETEDAAPRRSGRAPVDLGARLQEASTTPTTAALLSVHRVRKAYEQVADQLRALIVNGHLGVGDRLPNETMLAKEFGVSRATVREALRTLSAQRLILTAKGAGGGTYVSQPGFDAISDFLQANINLLTEMHHITLHELLEAREHLEVFAARLAAERRTDDDLARLHASVPSAEAQIDIHERFGFNFNFHSIVVETSGNSLLYIAALPVFSVLQTSLARTELSERWHEDVSHQHADIAEAIDAGDGDAAATLMGEHLAFIRPSYEAIWRHALEPGKPR